MLMLWRMKKSKYNMKETLDIAESVVTIIMFVMAVWGTIVSYESGFWHKLNHVVNHCHNEMTEIEKHHPELAEFKKEIEKHI